MFLYLFAATKMYLERTQKLPRLKAKSCVSRPGFCTRSVRKRHLVTLQCQANTNTQPREPGPPASNKILGQILIYAAQTELYQRLVYKYYCESYITESYITNMQTYNIELLIAPSIVKSRFLHFVLILVIKASSWN